MFDRMFVKFLIMIWPIMGIISYTLDSFLNIDEISLFALYLTFMALILIGYEVWACTIGENRNPEFIFRPNDLQ